tara:strand:+ start:5628 stop:8222 length:2595 start_codon:yes stop_codon:yes gene_type:complete
MAQHHNPRISTNGLIYHLDPTNGQTGEGATVAKPTDLNGNLDYPGLNGVRCELWLDASDLETIVHSSNSVSNWLDKSGEGSHAAEGSNKPTLVNGGWNGLSYLSFDGSNDQMTGALGNSIIHDTMFIVCQTKNSAGDAGIFYIGSSFTHKGFTHHNAANIYRYFSSGGIHNGISMARNVPHIISSSYYSGAGDLFCDGVANTTGSGTPANPSAATAYVIGNATNEIEMYLAEIIVYNNRLTAVDRKKIERYLSLKWAIPLAQRQMRNLADGVSMPAELVGSSNGSVCVTHRNTLEFRAPGLDDCDLRLEANEIAIADNLPWTIEFWIKRHARGNMGSGAGSQHAGVWGNSYTSSNYDRMQFGVSDEDKLVFGDSAGYGGEITNIADIDCLHKWRHVVVAFDGTTDPTTAGCVRQYVDGSDKGPAIALTTAPSDITVRRIGSRGHATDANRLEGELGNFRVYNKQLSHTEVLQNYNAQRAKYENKKMSFAAPDKNEYVSDFSAGADTWGAGGGAVLGNIDSIGGQNDNLKFTINTNNTTHYMHFNNGGNWSSVGDHISITFDYYIPSGNSHLDQLAFGIYGPATTMSTTDSWTSVAISFSVTQAYGFIIYATDGGANTFTDSGGDDVFYIRNFKYHYGGLKLYLDADSGTSTNDFTSSTWYDLSGGTAHNATRANATMTTTSPSALKGNYYDFDGTSDYFDVGASGAFAFGEGGFTVGAFIKTINTTADSFYRRIYMTDGPTGNNATNPQLAIVPTTGLVNAWSTSGSLDISSTTNVTDGVWHYVVMARSSGTVTLYIDGVSEATASWAEDVALNSGSPRPRIGSYNGTTGDFDGEIANIMIYAHALSADQIVQNYNYFKHRFGK